MVSFALAAMLLPLAMAGNVHYQQPMNYNVQLQGQMYMNNGQQGHMQMGNTQQHQQHQQVQQGNNQWWGMETQEEYDAYVLWCEERRLAIAQQEEQQALLHQIQEQAEERKRESAREATMKESRAKRDAMVAQWRMWQSQLSQADEFDGQIGVYMEMKVKYMFKLTMDFLKFCRCADYTQHLQRYLIHDGDSYVAGSDAYSLDELEGVTDITNVDAVAQQLASLTEAEQIKRFFGGAVISMCANVKAYVAQVDIWEKQYNFMGH